MLFSEPVWKPVRGRLSAADFAGGRTCTFACLVLLVLAGLFVAPAGLPGQPLAPTTLYVDSDDAQSGAQGDPVFDVNRKPNFSALFDHSNPAETAGQARIQIALDPGFSALVVSTGWKDVAPAAPGGRITDIEYKGRNLGCYTRYWWRIRMRDSAGRIGPWSTETASFVTIPCPHEAVALFVDGGDAQAGTQGDPVVGVSLKPHCSALVYHDNPSLTVTEARVQFSLDSTFSSILAGSAWQAFPAIYSGMRCPDIVYNGNGLPGATQVWWRIKFRDVAGTKGPWSSEPASFVTVPAPLEPTSLFVDSQDAQQGTEGDPASGIDDTPAFSAIYHHQSSSPARRFRVQVSESSDFSNIYWNGSRRVAGLADGERAPDLGYGGDPLAPGTTYFWRARFRDENGSWGPWSSVSASFTVTLQVVPVAAGLSVSGLLQGEEVPVVLTKIGGQPFSVDTTLTFAHPEVEAFGYFVASADVLQFMVRTGGRTPFGDCEFQVLDGSTVIAEGATYVYHPLQRAPDRFASISQEALLNPLVLGNGVSAHRGEFLHDAADVAIPGRVMPLAFGRSYRSFLAYNGATGRSWSSVIDDCLRFDASVQKIEWLGADGRLTTSSLASGGQVDVGPYVEAGRYAEWTRDNNGTPADPEDDVFTVLGAHGDRAAYAFGGTDHLGTPVFRLAAHADRLGNTVGYVRDAFGQLTEIRGDLYVAGAPYRHVLHLEYGDDGRLHRITDHADFSQDAAVLNPGLLGPRTWEYFYDADGALVEVRFPGVGSYEMDAAGANGRPREFYAYDTSTPGLFLLSELYGGKQANLDISSASGLPWLVNHFDANHRIVAQDVGPDSETDDTRRYRFVYGFGAIDMVDPLGRRTAAELDSGGRALSHTRHTGFFSVDASGNVVAAAGRLRASDPDLYTTTYEYNFQGEAIREVMPRGNEALRLFDDQNTSQRARGNLLRELALPGLVDASSLPVAQRNGLLSVYVYESDWNLPIAQAGPDAFDLAAGFDLNRPLTDQGQLSRDDRAFYTTTFAYDGVGLLQRITGPMVDVSVSPSTPDAGQQSVFEFGYNAWGQMTERRDASVYPAGAVGIVETWEYGASGFDRGYLVRRTVDPSGLAESAAFSYDSIGNLRVATSIAGDSTTSVYDQHGRVVQSRSPGLAALNGGHYVTDFSYDQDGNLTLRRMFDPVIGLDGQPTGSTRILETSWTHSTLGHVLSSTNTVDAQTQRTFYNDYDAAWQLVQQRSAGGVRSVQDWDELGRPWRTWYGLSVSGTGTAGAIGFSTIDYDPNGNVSTTIDARGFVRSRSYDAYDRPAVMEDARLPVATRTEFVYGHGGAPAEVAIRGDDGSGNATLLAQRREWRDNAGRIYRTADLALASDGVSPLGYSAAETSNNDMPGWSVQTTAFLPDGRTRKLYGDLLTGGDFASSTAAQSFEYDAAGRLTRSLDALGNGREFAYVGGRLDHEVQTSLDTSTSDLLTTTLSYLYDELNRVVWMQRDGQNAQVRAWNALNQLAWVDDPAESVTHYEYDLGARLIKTTRVGTEWAIVGGSPYIDDDVPRTIETAFEYDLDDNLARTIDNAGNQTLLRYDLAGRLVQTTFPNGGQVTAGGSHGVTPIAGSSTYVETTGGFDAAGNLLHLLDEGGNRIDRTFSPENEPTSLTVVRGAGSSIEGIESVAWEYDGMGRVLGVTTTQFGGGSHVHRNTWNTLSLAESYSTDSSPGGLRTVTRWHDELSRNFRTLTPDTDLAWTFDLLGRVVGYTAARLNRPTLHGSWAYFGSGGLRAAAAVKGDEDMEVTRDGRGRPLSLRNVSRADNSAHDTLRSVYNPANGLLEGTYSLDHKVPSSGGSSRLGGAPTGLSLSPGARYVGTRYHYDGFGRVTGVRHEAVYFQPSSPAVAPNWQNAADTHHLASAFDEAQFPAERGILVGDSTYGVGKGYLAVPHASAAGSVSNPVAVGQGSRLVPNAVGDVAMTRTADDQLKIAEDGQNSFVYDFRGRLLRTTRLSDGAVVEARDFDGLGLPYNQEMPEHLMVDLDFAAPDLAGVEFGSGDYRLDGGGLRFTGADPAYAMFHFPGGIARNGGSQVDGGLVSYHDFLLERDADPVSLVFRDHRHGSAATFRLEVAYSSADLYVLENGVETLVAQGSLPGALDTVTVGVQIETSPGYGPVRLRVYSQGGQRLDYTRNGMFDWAPTLVFLRADSQSGKLYRYKGYLDLDFSQADLHEVERYQRRLQALQSLCGSGLAVGEEAPTFAQDARVDFFARRDSFYSFLSEGITGGVERLADQLAEMDSLVRRAEALELAIKYNEALSSEINSLLIDFEDSIAEAPAPADIDTFLQTAADGLGQRPSVRVDPVVLAQVGQPLSIPFSVNVPNPEHVSIEVVSDGAFPPGMLVELLGVDDHLGWYVEHLGQLLWTPPAGAEGQTFRVRIRAKVPAIQEISNRPFAEAGCLVEVLPSVATVPVVGLAPLIPSSNGDSPFEYSHTRENYYTTYADDLYLLWNDWSTLQLVFSAVSHADPNISWTMQGLDASSSLQDNGGTAVLTWSSPSPGSHVVEVTATNSYGSQTKTLYLDVFSGQGWNVRAEHVRSVILSWEGQVAEGLVWGAGYRSAGYVYEPWNGVICNCVWVEVETFIRNTDFFYKSGDTGINLRAAPPQRVSSAQVNGPREVPYLGDLLSRDGVRAQHERWLRTARDDLLWMQDRFASLNASAGYGLTDLALRAETIQGIHREIAQRPAPPHRAATPLGNWLYKNYDAADDWLGGTGLVLGAGQFVSGVGDMAWAATAMPFELVGWAFGGDMPTSMQMGMGMWDRLGAFYDRQAAAGADPFMAGFLAALNLAGDMAGVNSIVSGVTRQGLLTGARLSGREGNAQITAGAIQLGLAIEGGLKAFGGKSAPKLSSNLELRSSGMKMPPVPRSPGLGESASVAQLIEGRLVPGWEGVILTDKTVVFTDLWRLSEEIGVEVALVRRNGKFVLYSGTENGVNIPKNIQRAIAHTHPSGDPFPSPADIDTLNRHFKIQLQQYGPATDPKPSRIIWGPRPDDYTPYYSNSHR